MKKKKVAIVDIESTGPNVKKSDEIIQLAAVIIEDGKVICEYNDYFKPSFPIPYHIEQITGISNESVSDAPRFRELVHEWYKRLDGCILVAHNLKFDLTILKDSFDIFGYTYNPIAIDTVRLSKIILPTSNGFNLTELSQYYGLKFDNVHNALEDARITARILSAMAHEVTKISSQTLSIMRPFIEALGNDEKIFFSNPELFIFEALPAQSVSRDKLALNDTSQNTNKLNQTISQLILSEHQNEKHLVVEDSTRPINPDVINQTVYQLLKAGDRVILSFAHEEELEDLIDFAGDNLDDYSTSILKHPNDFIHLEAFEYVVDNYNFKKSNEHELIVIAATIHWLSWTKTGDYSEIHSELQADSLIDRYGYQKKVRVNHYFYHQMQKKSQAADLVLTNHYHLISFIRSGSNWFKLDDFKLVVVDLDRLSEVVRNYQTKTIDISQAFSLLQGLSEDLKTAKGDEFRPVINELKNDLFDLVRKVEAYLKAKNKIESRKQQYLSSYIRNGSKLLNDITESLQRLLNNLNKISFNQDFLDLLKWPTRQRKFNEFASSLRKICQTYVNPHYWLVDGYSQNFNLFQLRIKRRPLKVNHRELDLFNSFKSCLLFSLGDYMYRQEAGTYASLELYDFSFYQLPKIRYSNRPKIAVPIGYSSVEKGEDEFSDHQVDFILDNINELNDYIVVVVASQLAIHEVYNKLSSSNVPELSDYFILAQGISGSLNKVRRRSMEFDKAIIIVDYHNLIRRHWFYENHKVSLLIQKLPYKSPENHYLTALADYLKTSEEEYFERIIYPDMVQTFKEFLVNIEYIFEIDGAYLFDERIYSKNYSNKLQKELEGLVSFELMK